MAGIGPKAMQPVENVKRSLQKLGIKLGGHKGVYIPTEKLEYILGGVDPLYRQAVSEIIYGSIDIVKQGGTINRLKSSKGSLSNKTLGDLTKLVQQIKEEARPNAK